MPAVRAYADKFLAYKQLVNEEYDRVNRERNERVQTQGAATRVDATRSFSGAMSISLDSFWRTFAQYVGIHLGPANLVVCAFVAIHCATGSPVFWPWAYKVLMHFDCTFAVLPLVLLIAPVTFITINLFRLLRRRRHSWLVLAFGLIIVGSVFYWVSKEQAQPLLRWLSLMSLMAVGPTLAFFVSEFAERPGLHRIGAAFSYALWTAMCLVVPVNTLVLLMACESIAVNAFLQIVVERAEPLTPEYSI